MRHRISIQCTDVATFPCDVLVLKFAQGFYGADEHIATKLKMYFSETNLTPGSFLILPTNGNIAAHEVLFVGVRPLSDFDYPQIREFAKRSLQILDDRPSFVENIAMTMHGVGYGLDERECFLAQIAGVLDAFETGNMVGRSANVTIVEKSEPRAARLKNILKETLPAEFTDEDYSPVTGHSIDAGAASMNKPHVFVAMPFSDEMEDVYFFGIQEPVHEAGLLCERVDMTTFTGDILERIKSRIETATFVIADLTGANPNVYLEVGYAWGKGRQTLLIAKQSDPLKFDVQSQRTLKYKNITDLAKKLRLDLSSLT